MFVIHAEASSYGSPVICFHHLVIVDASTAAGDAYIMAGSNANAVANAAVVVLGSLQIVLLLLVLYTFRAMML